MSRAAELLSEKRYTDQFKLDRIEKKLDAIIKQLKLADNVEPTDEEADDIEEFEFIDEENTDFAEGVAITGLDSAQEDFILESALEQAREKRS